MRRKTMLLVALMVGTMLLGTLAGIAWAKTFTCAPGSTQQHPCSGTKRADTITGTSGSDYIVAKAGNDTVTSNEGNDTIHAGGGNDDISGVTGDDTLYGEKGEDTIFDTIGPKYGQPADTDFAYGGPEKDFINVLDGDAQDTLCSGGGNDTVFADPQDIVDDPVVCN